MLARSPLAPNRFPNLPPLAGLRLGVASFGAYGRTRPNLLLVTTDRPATCAGLFTQSSLVGAPVSWTRRVTASGRAQALLVNAGNANVFTGAQGRADVEQLASQVAAKIGAVPEAVAAASTGVIGEPLDRQALSAALETLELEPSGPLAWAQAAEAIRTTDTFPKASVQVAETSKGRVPLVGLAKGSGMIAPNMATMLAFVFIQAQVPHDALQAMLERANSTSFNALTVDGDTSTSDMLLAFSLGEQVSLEVQADLAALEASLKLLCQDLAEQVARDGEGARKLLRVSVSGAESEELARARALAVANSPLVKTAVAGEDANWGRVLMALGKTQLPLDPERVRIAFGEHVVAELGARASTYDEAQVSAYLASDQIDLDIHLGLGPESARVWTCDLTEGYIRINADYRS